MGTAVVPRKKSETEPYEMTRFNGELLRKARSILAFTSQKISLGKYISEHARKGIEADYVRSGLDKVKRNIKPTEQTG